jgi:large subunit ribosomal protein L17e
MVRYSKEADNSTKAAKARASYLRVHYKHCREIAHAIKGTISPSVIRYYLSYHAHSICLGLKIKKAQSYLANVLQYKEGIPITKYTGGIGRHAAAKQHKAPGDKIAWPQKATKAFLDLLRNIEANAETKGLNIDEVKITHANCNQAPKMRRRTYRAHGRINAYMSCPAHIELMAEEAQVEVAKEKGSAPIKMSKKRAAQLKSKTVQVGGGADV